MILTHPLSHLSGVGPKMRELFLQLGLISLQDLLFHLPLRYQDRTRITSIASLQIGSHALIEGEIRQTALSGGRKVSLICEVSDATGSIDIRFFHFSAQQREMLSKGTKLRCFGEARRSYQRYGFEMIHPEYRMLNETPLPLAETLTPVYPTTQGVSQTLIRRLIDQALAIIQEKSTELELLPENLRHQFSLTDLTQALIYVHRPPKDAEVDLLLKGEHPMQKRLAFEELIAYLLSLQKTRQKMQRNPAKNCLLIHSGRDLFLQNLGFKLTTAQEQAVKEIENDLVKPYPMLRLLQGDVGSGKTVVAALAALRAIANSLQVALMVPSEILAEQHFELFAKWFKPLGIHLTFLAGKQATAVRKQTLAEIADGYCQLVVGTHALFQEEVKFANLGLCIVDEQHRFGVHQRLALRKKSGKNNQFPHQLMMSATPIPRTLSMVAYADLDVSVLNELPPGRKPVVTVLVSNNRRNEIMERVQAACAQHRQIYWVCTLIEESETLQCQAAEVTFEELQKQLPHCRIGLVHSRLPSEQKEAQMQAFKSAQIDLLVATTVIEVGVDVPNASLMIIENPERLGLAQLHQLRGRVGRGNIESYCVLLFKNPLSLLAKQRLRIMRETNDGFLIAEQDLAMRGPGEIYGLKQAGLQHLKIADLVRDQHLLPQVQAASQLLLVNHPEKAEALVTRWLNTSQHFSQA